MQLSAHDRYLHRIRAGDLVDSIAELQRHAEATPDRAVARLADLTHRLPVLIRPCVTAIVRPAQHDLRISALRNCVAGVVSDQ